jgi:hypothetical protein
MGRIKSHHYRVSAYVPMYLALSFTVIVLGGNGVAFLTFAAQYPGDEFSGLLLVISALVVACWYPIFHLQHLPVCYDDDGLSTVSGGKRRRTIAWHDVTRIERIRREDLITRAYRHTFFVISTAQSIRFDDRIDGLQDLLNAINVFAGRYTIPLISIDHGSDTHERQLLIVKDKKGRKQLEREGVRNSLSTL